MLSLSLDPSDVKINTMIFFTWTNDSKQPAIENISTEFYFFVDATVCLYDSTAKRAHRDCDSIFILNFVRTSIARIN